MSNHLNRLILTTLEWQEPPRLLNLLQISKTQCNKERCSLIKRMKQGEVLQSQG
jgi:hypothetical protein